jgi:hypothetical protein
MRRTIALAIVAVLGVAACGGDDDDNSSSATPKSSNGSSTSSAADASNGNPQAYVDALVKNGLSSENAPKGVTTEQLRCIAEPIVDVYGTDAFEKAGYTVAKLRQGDTALDRLPAPTGAQLSELGERLQSCELGDLLAAELAKQFGGSDENTEACISDKIDHDQGTGRFLAAGFVGQTPDTATATSFANTMVACVNIGRVVLEPLSFDFTAEETDCVNNKLKSSDAFLKAFAASFTAPDTQSPDLEQAVKAALTACVTPQRLQQAQASATP